MTYDKENNTEYTKRFNSLISYGLLEAGALRDLRGAPHKYQIL